MAIEIKKKKKQENGYLATTNEIPSTFWLINRQSWLGIQRPGSSPSSMLHRTE